MTVIMDVAVPAAAFALGRVFASTAASSTPSQPARIDLPQSVSLGDPFVPYIWVTTDTDDIITSANAGDSGPSGERDRDGDGESGVAIDGDEFGTSVAADSRIAQVTKVTENPDRSLYHIEWATDCVNEDPLLSTFTEHAMAVERAIGTATEWTFRVRAPDGAALAAIQQTCRNHEVPIDVRDVFHNPTEERDSPENESEGAYALTQRQRQAIMLALEKGYFDIPRTTTLAALGEQLNISHQAVSHRLQRGLNNILTETMLTND